ncbi:hypothetical protein [Nocardia jiangxiensis]|uniref:hypothetical protein n=1 Tax=Nocardia jiangxiensis TaxID=282685 RepID=UPI0002EEDA07|nr:hypothetical protein [Nocardia jiangxiensis]
MSTNTFRGRGRAARLEAEALDAVIDIRTRRRAHYERSGLDPVSLAVHAWAETGHVPGWDEGIDYTDDNDFDGGWAA